MPYPSIGQFVRAFNRDLARRVWPLLCALTARPPIRQGPQAQQASIRIHVVQRQRAARVWVGFTAAGHHCPPWEDSRKEEAHPPMSGGVGLRTSTMVDDAQAV